MSKYKIIAIAFAIVIALVAAIKVVLFLVKISVFIIGVLAALVPAAIIYYTWRYFKKK